jgi:hypothetical protein
MSTNNFSEKSPWSPAAAAESDSPQPNGLCPKARMSSSLAAVNPNSTLP